MARIVVNKHYDISRNITADKFVNKGELVISNEPGYEGIYVINTRGEVVKIGGMASGGASIDGDFAEFLQSYYLTSAETVNYVNEVSGNIATFLENFNGGGVQSDWNETDSKSKAYILNKPNIIDANDVREISAEEIAKIVASADTSFDTLKEIADWILNDATGAAKMANDIAELQSLSANTRLDNLEASAHTHNNADILDSIDEDRVESWDNAEKNAKEFASGLTQEMKEYLENLINRKNADHYVMTGDEYEILVASGSVVVCGETIEFSETAFYCTYEEERKKEDSGEDEAYSNVEVIKGENGENVVVDDNGIVTTEDGKLIIEIPDAFVNGEYIEFVKRASKPNSSTNVTVEENDIVMKTNEDFENGILSLPNVSIDNNIIIF